MIPASRSPFSRLDALLSRRFGFSFPQILRIACHSIYRIPAPFFGTNALDIGQDGVSGSLGYPSTCYKVVDRRDGFTYCLRRVDNVRGAAAVLDDRAHRALQSWRRVQHPNVVPLHDAFAHHRALFFKHEFCPGAQSLQEQLLSGHGPMLPERAIWSFLTQVATALRAIHTAGLACHAVNPLRILVVGNNRYRIAGCGIFDVLEGDEVAKQRSLAERQHDDLANLGKLTLLLGCRGSANDFYNFNLQAAAENFSRNSYSTDLQNAAMAPFVAASKQQLCSVYDVLSTMTRGLVTELDER